MTTKAKATPIVCIIGPSGVGKTTAADRLGTARMRGKVLTSHTDRPKRDSEPESAYHFVSPEEFTELDLAGVFVESTQYSGNNYGLAYEEIVGALTQGLIPYVVVSRQGADELAKRFGRHTIRKVLLVPPSEEELRLRMEKRGSTEEEIGHRLVTAYMETAAMGMDLVVVTTGTPSDVASEILSRLELEV